MGEESKRRSFLKHLLSMTAFGAGSVLALKENIGDKIGSLEMTKANAAVGSGKKAKSFEERIAAMEAAHDVQDVMSRYFFYHAANYHKECWEKLFAHKALDVSVEIADWGKWEGPEHVKTFFCDYLGGGFGDPKGAMMVHGLDTPCIQVAGDGKTAKGVWFSPGHETSSQNGKASASWCWSYIGTDFIKEDGEWKIWHYHCYAMFKTPFEKSWATLGTEENKPAGVGFAFPKGLEPNKPTHDFNEYTPTSIRTLVPAPAEPYETFDPAKAY